MAVLNEERYIARALGGMIEQDYPADRYEIIVADGMSTDRTREIVQSIQAEHPHVRLIDNPRRIVPTGLNAAIRQARGEIIVRVDGHSEFPRDYVRRVVELRERTGADNAGGVHEPCGHQYTSRAIAAAFYSRVGVGGAMSGHSGREEVREVDAVQAGCWRKERLLAVGLFDEEMVRNQDDELSFRLRKAGGRVVQSTAIRFKYAVRDSFRKLFLQYAQYGYWKVRVILKHPQQTSVRHFVPALFVLGLIVGAALAPVSPLTAWAFAALALSYCAAIACAALVEARRSEWRLWPGIAWALGMMHLGYGLGSLVGWLRRVTGPLPTDRIFERVTR
jgi:glycosyltransferase involved in cell wall biosynthesis